MKHLGRSYTFIFGGSNKRLFIYVFSYESLLSSYWGPHSPINPWYAFWILCINEQKLPSYLCTWYNSCNHKNFQNKKITVYFLIIKITMYKLKILTTSKKITIKILKIYNFQVTIRSIPILVSYKNKCLEVLMVESNPTKKKLGQVDQ